MTEALVCWKCGVSISDQPLPLSRVAECRSCGADLHVCRMCEFYDPRVAGACREPIAEEVKDKERSNFCDYFKTRADAYRPHNDTTARDARAKLDALFGTGSSREEGSADRGSGPSSEAQNAKEKLERLFGLKEKPRG